MSLYSDLRSERERDAVSALCTMLVSAVSRQEEKQPLEQEYSGNSKWNVETIFAAYDLRLYSGAWCCPNPFLQGFNRGSVEHGADQAVVLSLGFCCCFNVWICKALIMTIEALLLLHQIPIVFPHSLTHQQDVWPICHIDFVFIRLSWSLVLSVGYLFWWTVCHRFEIG